MFLTNIAQTVQKSPKMAIKVQQKLKMLILGHNRQEGINLHTGLYPLRLLCAAENFINVILYTEHREYYTPWTHHNICFRFRVWPFGRRVRFFH